MRAKSIFLLLLALLCGLVASIGITQVMAKRSADSASAGETQTIFVAMKDIGMGDPITAQMVKREEWPKENLPTGALTNWEDVESRRPKTRIFAGSPILEGYLLGKGMSDLGASGVIPKGFRVVPVKVDAGSSGGGIIRPTDRVDVLIYVKEDKQRGIAKTITKTVLQNIKVFAVNDVWDVASTSGDKTLTAKTISLLVTPEQAEVITMATELGTIRVVMRSPEDDAQKDLRGLAAQDIVGADGSVLPNESEPKGDSSATGVKEFLQDLAGGKPTPPVAAPVQPSAAPAPPAAVEPEKTQSFTLRILAGSQMTDAVLQAPADDPSGTGAPLWTVKSSSSVNFDHAKPSGNGANAAKPAHAVPVAKPAAGEPATQQPAADEEGTDDKTTSDSRADKSIKALMKWATGK